MEFWVNIANAEGKHISWKRLRNELHIHVPSQTCLFGDTFTTQVWPYLTFYGMFLVGQYEVHHRHFLGHRGRLALHRPGASCQRGIRGRARKAGRASEL